MFGGVSLTPKTRSLITRSHGAGGTLRRPALAIRRGDSGKTPSHLLVRKQARHIGRQRPSYDVQRHVVEFSIESFHADVIRQELPMDSWKIMTKCLFLTHLESGNRTLFCS